MHWSYVFLALSHRLAVIAVAGGLEDIDMQPIKIWNLSQCSKLLPVRLPEADNFGGGPGTFSKIFVKFMFMIWDSRQEGWQLFWLSFEQCLSWHFSGGMSLEISWIGGLLMFWAICLHLNLEESKFNLRGSFGTFVFYPQLLNRTAPVFREKAAQCKHQQPAYSVFSTAEKVAGLTGPDQNFGKFLH